MNTNRFGISALSKSRYNDAYNEELLVDKDTGEYLVKTRSGDVISYDYIDRLDTGVCKLFSTGEALCFYGELYKLSIDNKRFPLILTANENILDEPETIGYNLTRFILGFDLSSLLVTENELTTENVDVKVTISFKVNYTDSTSSTYIDITERCSLLNDKIIDLSDSVLFPDIDGEKIIEGITFDSITVSNDVYDYDSKTYTELDNLRHILHSVLILLN